MDNYERESELYIALQKTFFTHDEKAANNLYTVNCMGKNASQIREINRTLIRQVTIKHGPDALSEIPGASDYLLY